jgi:hypothetical protein
MRDEELEATSSAALEVEVDVHSAGECDEVRGRLPLSVCLVVCRSLARALSRLVPSSLSLSLSLCELELAACCRIGRRCGPQQIKGSTSTSRTPAAGASTVEARTRGTPAPTDEQPSDGR